MGVLSVAFLWKWRVCLQLSQQYCLQTLCLSLSTVPTFLVFLSLDGEKGREGERERERESGEGEKERREREREKERGGKGEREEGRGERREGTSGIYKQVTIYLTGHILEPSNISDRTTCMCRRVFAT